jgi:hypothetical protein
MSIAAAGKALFFEAMGVKSPTQTIVASITESLNKLEQFRMTPERIASLQKCIFDFSDLLHSYRTLLVDRRKFLSDTMAKTGHTPAAFAEFITLSKFSVLIRNLSDQETAFIERMHTHLYTLIHKDIDELSASDYSLDKMETITTNFQLLTHFLNTLTQSCINNLKEVRKRAKQEAPAIHLGHLPVDLAAAGERLIDLKQEAIELSQKYEDVIRDQIHS